MYILEQLSATLIVGSEDSEAMLTQPAWRLMRETARQEKWQVHLDGEAECWLKAG